MTEAWKDSSDSIFHADGRFPPPPLAVVEVRASSEENVMPTAKRSALLGSGD
jgi:glycogen debranching enzyme